MDSRKGNDMMRVAICDDLQQQCDEIEGIWKDCVDENFSYEVESFLSAEALLQAYQQGCRFDILILDIKMDKINGMEAARQIRILDQTVKIIFLTAYDQYMRDAFDVSAMHYLDKPVDAVKLKTLFRQAIRSYREAHYALYVPVMNQNNMEEKVQLFTSEILFFESYNRKVTIYLISGETYATSMKISQLEQELRTRNFVRTHMSFLVNVKYIRKINRMQVTLKYQEKEHVIPISRKQKELVEKTFLDYRVGDYKLC